MAEHAHITPRRRLRASCASAAPRAQIEAAIERLIDLLDQLDGDPDLEPEVIEEEPDEASAAPLTLAPDRLPARRIRTARRHAEPPLGAARTIPVVGNAMEPTLRNGDVVFAVPTDGYRFEGIYALSLLPGGLDLYRAQSVGGGQIRISRDNPAYSACIVSAEDFNRAVLGQVVATGRVIAPTLLEGRDAA